MPMEHIRTTSYRAAWTAQGSYRTGPTWVGKVGPGKWIGARASVTPLAATAQVGFDWLQRGEEVQDPLHQERGCCGLLDECHALPQVIEGAAIEQVGCVNDVPGLAQRVGKGDDATG